MIQQILTEKAFYIFIAVLGFFSSIVTMFVTTSDKISIKWLLFETLIAVTIILILIRTILILVNIKNINQSIKLVKHININNKNILILKSSIELPVNSLLVIYKKDEGHEQLHAIGYVENIQEDKLIAVKVTKLFIKSIESSFDTKKSIIKTMLPNTILEEISGINE